MNYPFMSIGSLLQDSGWTAVRMEAGIASPGTAESFLVASSIARAHQITAYSLSFFRLLTLITAMKQLEAPRKYPASKLGVIFADSRVPTFSSGIVNGASDLATDPILQGSQLHPVLSFIG